MYLYATTVRPGQASPAKVTEWALHMTEKINQISEVPASLWTAAMSPNMGTLTWTSVVEDLAIIEATETKLAADSGYLLLVDEAIGLLAPEPPQQNLIELVYPDPAGGSIDARYVSTVEARINPGSFSTGVLLGVEIAQQAAQITGRPTSFGMTVTGDYGAVAWYSLAETIEQVQEAQRAISSNPEFAARLDQEASAAFSPGTQVLSRRLI